MPAVSLRMRRSFPAGVKAPSVVAAPHPKEDV